MIDAQTILLVLKAIQDHGPITARQISEGHLGLPYGNDATGPTIREAVHEARLAGNFIAASVDGGYWIEVDPWKQVNYLRGLRERIASIQKMHDALARVANKVQPGLFDGEGP